MLQQAVVQRAPQLPYDKRFLINQDLWNALDNDGKASLMLHEIIYTDALAREHRSSVYVRYFNSLLISGIMATMSEADYAAVMLATRLDEYFNDDVMFQRYRYFPKKALTLAEAKAFCLALPNGSRLWGGENLGAPDPSWAITRYILGPDGQGSVAVWADGSSMSWTYNTFVYAATVKRETRDPEAHQPPLCFATIPR